MWGKGARGSVVLWGNVGGTRRCEMQRAMRGGRCREERGEGRGRDGTSWGRDYSNELRSHTIGTPTIYSHHILAVAEKEENAKICCWEGFLSEQEMSVSGREEFLSVAEENAKICLDAGGGGEDDAARISKKKRKGVGAEQEGEKASKGASSSPRKNHQGEEQVVEKRKPKRRAGSEEAGEETSPWITRKTRRGLGGTPQKKRKASQNLAGRSEAKPRLGTAPDEQSSASSSELPGVVTEESESCETCGGGAAFGRGFVGCCVLLAGSTKIC